MAGILRGEIRWAEIERAQDVIGHEQGNRRPVLILSNDQFNARTHLIIAALITSSGGDGPHRTRIASVAMPRPSWVLTGQIRTLSAQRLGEPLGRISEEEIESVLRSVFRNMSP
jgi:mRNA interferase MazF